MGKVRAVNVPVAKSVNVEINLSPVDITSGAVAALTLHLSEATQNVSEAARVFARAKFAGVDLATVQKRCFDNNVSGTLMKRAFALAKDHTPESLAKADAAASALQAGADKARHAKAREKREAANNEPLTVKAFALALGARA
jgi:hypothetical protein